MVVSHDGIAGNWKSGHLLTLVCPILFFQDSVSLYSSGCPKIHSVDQAGLQLKIFHSICIQSLGLKGCVSTIRCKKML